MSDDEAVNWRYVYQCIGLTGDGSLNADAMVLESAVTELRIATGLLAEALHQRLRADYAAKQEQLAAARELEQFVRGEEADLDARKVGVGSWTDDDPQP